jgi:hypothetical protein
MIYALAMILALQPAPTPQVTFPIRVGPLRPPAPPRDVLNSATVSIPTIGAIHADTVKIYNAYATVSARPGKWNVPLANASFSHQKFALVTIVAATMRYSLHGASITSYQGVRSYQSVPTITFTLIFASADRHAR